MLMINCIYKLTHTSIRNKKLIGIWKGKFQNIFNIDIITCETNKNAIIRGIYRNYKKLKLIHLENLYDKL